MICYKDKTFCTYWLQCKDGYACNRALTPQVKEDADRWWKGFKHPEEEPPIAIYGSPPSCYCGNANVNKCISVDNTVTKGV